MLKKSVCLLLFAVANLCCLPPQLQAGNDPLAAYAPKFDPRGASYTYILSNISHPIIEAVNVGYRIRDRVWKESNGRLYVDYRPLAQLGGEKDVINKLKLGAVQGMLASSVASANIAERFGIVHQPFVINTFDKLDKFRTTPALWQPFADSALSSGIMVADINSYGPFGWATTSPVRSIADAKRLNFRIAEAPVNVDVYKAWGLKFTVMPWPDVPQALQTGVITGLDHTAIVCNITKKFSVAKYFTEVDYAQGLFLHLMNKGWFDKLPADLQQILITAIEEESATSRVATRKQHAEQVAKAKEAGVEFIRISAADEAMLEKMLEPVYATWGGKIGRDYLANVVTSLSQTGTRDVYVDARGAKRPQFSPPAQQYPPDLKVSATFFEPSGNRLLDAEETGQITLTFENHGRGDAYNLETKLSTSSKISGLSYPQKVAVGDLKAGQSKTKVIELAANERLGDGELRLRIDSLEGNGFGPDPVEVVFVCNPLVPPQLILADLGINDQNGNARIEPKEFVEVTARIQNTGYGDARKATARVELGSNVFLAADSANSFDLGSLKPGEHKDVSFSIYTNKRINAGEEIPVKIHIGEDRPRFARIEKLDLKMDSSTHRIQQVLVEALPQKDTRKEQVAPASSLRVDVDQDIPFGKKAGEYDVAVVIGNRDYTAPNVPSVDYAIRDANIMIEYLHRTLGFKAENIIFEENATLSKFFELFGNDRDPAGKLARYVDPEGSSHVFVYYTGHGAPDLKTGDAYFVPVSADPQYLSTSGYSLETLYRNLSKIPARKMTIVLDACFSGNSEQGLLFQGISPAMLKTKALAQGPRQAIVFTSASSDQVSAWYHEKKHSLFTYYFLKGLQGQADNDKNKSITVAEMESYLKKNVTYMAGRLRNINQDPKVSGDRGAVLAELQ